MKTEDAAYLRRQAGRLRMRAVLRNLNCLVVSQVAEPADERPFYDPATDQLLEILKQLRAIKQNPRRVK
jgi:hypothetical protein